MLSAERFRATDHRKSRRYKYPVSLDFSPIMCYNIARNEVSGYGEGSDTGKRLFIGCSLPLRRGVKALLCGRELTGALSADSDLSRAIGRSAHAAPRIRDRDGRARAESSRRGCHGGIPCGSGSGFAGGAGKRLPFGGSEGKSPSCGVGKVYDGSFSGKLVTGDGITVRLLQEHGIRVIGESEIPGIIREKVV